MKEVKREEGVGRIIEKKLIICYRDCLVMFLSCCCTCFKTCYPKITDAL